MEGEPKKFEAKPDEGSGSGESLSLEAEVIKKGEAILSDKESKYIETIQKLADMGTDYEEDDVVFTKVKDKLLQMDDLELASIMLILQQIYTYTNYWGAEEKNKPFPLNIPEPYKSQHERVGQLAYGAAHYILEKLHFKTAEEVAGLWAMVEGVHEYKTGQS